MRKVIITEAQLKYICKESFDTYLPNVGDACDVPANAQGNQVFTSDNEGGKEEDPEAQSKPITVKMGANQKFFKTNGLGRIAEDKKKIVDEANFDDEKSHNFGKKSNDFFQAAAQNSNSEMLNNLAGERKDGSRNNTNQKRLHDMLQYKETNPEQYAKNGGDATVKALKSFNTKTQQNHANEAPSILDKALTTTPNVTKGTGKGHHKDGEELSNGGILHYEN